MRRFSLHLLADAFTFAEVHEAHVFAIEGSRRSLNALVDVLLAVSEQAVNEGKAVWGAILVLNDDMVDGVLRLKATVERFPTMKDFGTSPMVNLSLKVLEDTPIERLKEFPGERWTLELDFR